MRLAFLYCQASLSHQDIFMLLTFSFLSAMGFGNGIWEDSHPFTGDPFDTETSVLTWVPQGSTLLPKGGTWRSLLSVSWHFSPASKADADQDPQMISQSHWAPLRARAEFSHHPQLGAWCSLEMIQLEAWASDLLLTAVNRSGQGLASPQLFKLPPSVLDPNLSLVQIYDSW